MTYDARGSVTTLTDPSGATTAINYNDLGKLTQVVNALGQTLTMQYDPAGHLLEVINNAGHRTIITRDVQGRVTSLTDAVGNQTRLEYDGGCACGRPGKVINPDGTSRLYRYTSQGLTNRVVNELGAEFQSTYDDAGRLLFHARPSRQRDTASITVPSSPTSSMRSAEAPATSTMPRERPNRIIDAEGGVVELRYDPHGNRTHVIDPVGNVTELVYDDANRLRRPDDPLGHVSRFAYDAAGNRIEAIDRNGRSRTFEYDAMNRMTHEHWWEENNLVPHAGVHL